jgi:hypothetical protein
MGMVAYFGKDGIEIPTEIKYIIDPTGDGVVSIGDFQIFCNLYGPFKESMSNIDSKKTYFKTIRSFEI